MMMSTWLIVATIVLKGSIEEPSVGTERAEAVIKRWPTIPIETVIVIVIAMAMVSVAVFLIWLIRVIIVRIIWWLIDAGGVRVRWISRRSCGLTWLRSSATPWAVRCTITRIPLLKAIVVVAVSLIVSTIVVAIPMMMAVVMAVMSTRIVGAT
jgi:hypothetical protein